MSKILKQDTDGTKALLGVGELGYDNYPAGGDKGRVWVGDGTSNIAMSKKAELDTHKSDTANPHAVTKAQVGLGSADNTADNAKNVLSATKLTTARTIGGVTFDGTSNINLPGVNVAGNQSTTGNAATATNLSTDRTTWNTNGTLSATVGQLAWNNYGNNHTIFDASKGLTPNGVSKSNTTPDAPWSATFPTLMGYNGNSTYGVRVDISARSEACTGNAATATKLAATKTINGVAFDGSANITTYDSTKVAKVTSTDNAVVRFNGTSGEVQNSGVIIDDNNNVGIGTSSPDSRLHIASSGVTRLHLENILSTGDGTHDVSIQGYKPNVGYNNVILDFSSYIFKTSAQERMRIDSAGNLLLQSGTGALGYGIGAGGTVTQLTSKSTAVTLNKPSGVIIMNSEALAAGATVGFWFYNSLFSYGYDNLIITMIGVNSGIVKYRLHYGITGNGGAEVYISNVGNSSFSDTITLKFELIKGSTN